jgi:hypothetical protein
MVRLRSAATLLTVVVFALTARAAAPPGAQSWPPQLQLQMQVPFEPSAFPSAGRTYLIYELNLSNFESRPVTIDRVDVLDADDSKPIATFEAQQLNTILHHVGTPILGDQIPAADDDSQRQLAPGERVLVAYLYSFEPHLHFEITTSPGTLDGEGIPYIIDQYSVWTPDHGEPERRKRELPLKGTLVDFRMSH